MNSKNVLNRILTLLSMEEKEEKFTYAKLADGTIVESPTFDVGEPVEIVTEEGKSPAPDGTHELALRDEEGNEVLIKVRTEGGIIVERENVELPAEEEEKAVEELESIAGADMGGDEEGDEETDSVLPLPEDFAKSYQELAYRIEELEKRLKKFEEVKEEVVDKKADIEEELEEEELPKLDGAPVEEGSAKMKKFGKQKTTVSTQAMFLSRLYN
jgi:hypothetical protein